MSDGDVERGIAALREAVEKARSMPMSASAVVNRTELLGLVASLEEAIAEAQRESAGIVARGEEHVASGRTRAEEIVREATEERDRLVSDTEVYRVAKRQADAVVAEARTEASELRTEVDEYVDGKLADFEITLGRTMQAVRRGRGRLADRSPLDSRSDDGEDRVPLPERLDG